MQIQALSRNVFLENGNTIATQNSKSKIPGKHNKCIYKSNKMAVPRTVSLQLYTDNVIFNGYEGAIFENENWPCIVNLVYATCI